LDAQTQSKLVKTVGQHAIILILTSNTMQFVLDSHHHRDNPD